jgi:hypothetical protein
VVLAHEFLSRILADGAKLVIHIRDGPLNVCGGDDGMLVESKLLIGQFLECELAGTETLPQCLLCPFPLGDIRADRNVLTRLAILTGKRDDGRIHPVNPAIFGAVADLAPPHLAVGDGMVHLLEKLFGMVARVEDAMVLAQQLLLGIFAEGTEFVVDIGDGSLNVGSGDDGVLVESVFLVGHFLERLLTFCQAIFYRFLDSHALGDLGLQGRRALCHALFQFRVQSVDLRLCS